MFTYLRASSRELAWPSGKALGCKEKSVGSIPLLLAFLLKKLWFMDTVFLTLPLTINRNLKTAIIAAHVDAGVTLVVTV